MYLHLYDKNGNFKNKNKYRYLQKNNCPTRHSFFEEETVSEEQK